MPEPEGKADPPWLCEFPDGNPAASARLWLRLYRSGAGLLVFEEVAKVGEFNSTADKGRGLGLIVAAGIDVSSFEPVCCDVKALERFTADTDDNRFWVFVERFGEGVGFVRGVTGAEAVRVS